MTEPILESHSRYALTAPAQARDARMAAATRSTVDNPTGSRAAVPMVTMCVDSPAVRALTRQTVQ